MREERGRAKTDDDKPKSNKEDSNQPGLVRHRLILVVPLQLGGRHGSELAVEPGLLIPQHHHVLRRDHRPWETLICKRVDKHSHDCSRKPPDHQVSYVWILNRYKKGAKAGFIKALQRQRKVVKND